MITMMGTTPSLSQNDLHLPASTQQNDKAEWKSSYTGILPTVTPANDTIAPILTIPSLPTHWATSKYAGANDPIFTYDDTYNRYTYSKFHTSYFTGNGRFQYGNSGASTSPSTEELLTKGRTSAFSKQITLPNGYVYFIENTGYDIDFSDYKDKEGQNLVKIEENQFWSKSQF